MRADDDDETHGDDNDPDYYDDDHDRLIMNMMIMIMILDDISHQFYIGHQFDIDHQFDQLIMMIFQRLLDICHGQRMDREMVLYLVFEHVDQVYTIIISDKTIIKNVIIIFPYYYVRIKIMNIN